MSILEKLKDLVEALETAEEPKQEEETPEFSEPSVEVEEEDASLPAEPEEIPAEESEEEQTEEEAVEELPDYLECTQEESLVVLEKIALLRDTRTALGELVLSFEEKRSQLISQVYTTKGELLASVESLRLEYGIPKEGYKVQLPSSLSDKVSFSKKD